MQEKPVQPVELETFEYRGRVWMYPSVGALLGGLVGLFVGYPLPTVIQALYGYVCLQEPFQVSRLILQGFTLKKWPDFSIYTLSFAAAGAVIGAVCRRLKENRERLKNLSHDFEIQVATLRHHYKNLTLGIDGFAHRIKRKLDFLEEEFKKCAQDNCPTYLNFHKEQETLKRNVIILQDAAARLTDILSHELHFLKALVSDSLVPAPGDLYALLKQAITELTGLRFREKELHLSINGRPWEECQDTLVFPFEPYSLEVILQNILSNAMQYGDHVGVAVTKANKRVRIEVADNGPGVDLQKLRRFLLTPADRKPTGASTHLGMKVTLQLLSKCQGRLFALSSPGEGSTFIIEIPG